MTLRRLALAGGVLGGGGLALLVWAPQLLWGAAIAAIALALPIAACVAIFRPPNASSLCPACREDGLVRGRCPSCGHEILEEGADGE